MEERRTQIEERKMFRREKVGGKKKHSRERSVRIGGRGGGGGGGTYK